MESLRENKLYSASINGDVNSLNQLLEEDSYVLEYYGTSNAFSLNGTPLHIAATRGHVEFAEVLLQHKPQLVGELDSRFRTPLHLAVTNGRMKMVQLLLKHAQREDNNVCLMADEFGRTPLHLASAKGSEEMVKLLLENADNGVCLLTDEFGRTPLHLAILMNAGPKVVKELAIPEAIADLLSSSKTVRILHSYILRNGLDSLQIFANVNDSASVDSFLCSQDEEGNTILHRVVSLRRKEMLEYLIPKHQNDRYPVAVNLTNRNNLTILDLIDQMPRDPKTKSIRKHITNNSSVDTAKKNWFDKKKNAIMIVATLIAGMAYQAGLSPPGGVWDEDKENVVTENYGRLNTTAGTSIMSLKDPFSYNLFWLFNTISFVGALSIVLLLIMNGSHRKSLENRFRGYLRRVYLHFLTFILWVTATSMIVAYVCAAIGIWDGAYVLTAIKVVVVGGFSWIGFILVVCIIMGSYYITRIVKKMVNLSRQIYYRNVNAYEHQHGNNNGTTGRCCAFV